MSKTEFPESLWDELVERAARGGDAVRDRLAALPGDEHRRAAYAFAANALAMRDWKGKSLDVIVAVSDAAIAEGVRQSARAATDDDRRACTDWANVQSYNLAANLADCWSGDELPRARPHFERGLRAADDCLRWRRELAKGPGPFSMAHWAEGYHALALGDRDRAVAGFRESLRQAELAATAAGCAATLDSASTFAVVLGHGYLGLAIALSGDADQLRLTAVRRGLDEEAG